MDPKFKVMYAWFLPTNAQYKDNEYINMVFEFSKELKPGGQSGFFDFLGKYRNDESI